MKYEHSYTLITRVTGFISRTFLYFRRTELKYISNILGDTNNLRILDYGCNTGYFLNMIKKEHPNSNFDLNGADINPYALKYARSKYKNFTFYDINENFFSKEKFDVIILSHVLEHVIDGSEMIRKIKLLLKPDGRLIIAIPQERIRGDCTIIQLLYNIIRLRFENPHVVKINYGGLEKILQNNNLKITNHIYTNFFFPFKSNNLKFYSWSLVAVCVNTN